MVNLLNSITKSNKIIKTCCFDYGLFSHTDTHTHLTRMKLSVPL